jgi:hypothetical protein
MANFKYFSDINGETVELVIVSQMRNEEFARRFPGVKGFRLDSFSKRVGYAAGATKDGQELPMTRAIEYKSFPSRHECNAKCMGGKVNGMCECKCGGKNHGAGMFRSLIAEAA